MKGRINISQNGLGDAEGSLYEAPCGRVLAMGPSWKRTGGSLSDSAWTLASLGLRGAVGSPVS